MKEFNIKALPKSWEEFCDCYYIGANEAVLNHRGDIESMKPLKDTRRHEDLDRCVLPNSIAARRHRALMQLHQLRDCWRQGWIPDWNNNHQPKYVIEIYGGAIAICKKFEKITFLSFPDHDMAISFVYFFRDLIEEAGDLI